jgi:anaphase-promoting complex subunit 1
LNVNQTAPGALIALALIYVKSNNLEVAQRVSIPQTSFDLDNIRPDLLIYRSLANSLILWDSVTPSSCWLVSKIPQVSIDVALVDLHAKISL